MHNRDFLATIADEHCDWMVTVAFYAAVHAVEALFAHDKLPNHASHADRHQTLKRVNRYKKIWQHYRTLWEAAHAARYDVSPQAWIPAKDVKERLVRQTLYPLEASVLKLLESDTTLAPIAWASEKATGSQPVASPRQ